MIRDEKLYSNGATDIHRNQTEVNTSSSLRLWWKTFGSQFKYFALVQIDGAHFSDDTFVKWDVPATNACHSADNARLRFPVGLQQIIMFDNRLILLERILRLFYWSMRRLWLILQLLEFVNILSYPWSNKLINVITSAFGNHIM